MHGDFSNITFSPHRNYTTVFELQGRIGLDANRNEQTAILLHQMRSAIRDLIGPAAGPATNLGFKIEEPEDGDFTIGPGRYYVDGIAVDNPTRTTYLQQPQAFIDKGANEDKLPARYLIYLKVWERHITEVENPDMHEPALGIHHPDTTSRAQVVWQVRAFPITGDNPPPDETWLHPWASLDRRGALTVSAQRSEEADDDPCTAAPDSAYTGENQLYRLQIHSGGEAGEGASFVWSRDNGSVIYPIAKHDGKVVQVKSLGRDWHTTLEIGHWVEFIDDAVSLGRDIGTPNPAPSLHQVVDLDIDTATVTIEPALPASVGNKFERHPYLRRWDHVPPAGSPDGAIPIREKSSIPLENGIEVRFAAGTQQHVYRTGDYWVFPARRTLGDVIWPYPTGGSSPHGLAIHYAPLAFVNNGIVQLLRTSFAVPLKWKQ